MNIPSPLRTLLMAALGLSALPATLLASPLSVDVTSETTVVSDYRPADFFFVASLSQSINLIAPPTLSINGVTDSVSLTLSAPAGRILQVDPLAEGLSLFIDVNYVDGDATSLGNILTTDISFEGLAGTAPTLSSSLGFYPYGLLFQIRFYDFSNAFSFTRMTVTSTIDGTGANVTFNRQTVMIQAQDTDYSGPTTEPYAALLSTAPAPVPEPGTAILPLALGALLLQRLQKRSRLAA